MGREVEGHVFDAYGLPCCRCGLREEEYDVRPTKCKKAPVSHERTTIGSSYDRRKVATLRLVTSK